MRYTQIIILLLLSTCLGYSQDLSWKELNLSDSIKSITEISYIGKLSGDEYIRVRKGWESNWQQDSKSEFDSLGNKVKETFYDSEFNVTRVNNFTFSSGSLIKSDMLYHTRIYEYDTTGKLISMKQINKNPDQNSDSNTDIQENVNFSIYKFIYNENNTLIKKLEFDNNQKQIGVTHYFYDDNDRLVKDETTYNDEKDWCHYSYDTIGNLIEETWSDNVEGTLGRLTYAYEDNVLIKETWETFTDGIVDGKVSYTYENGNEKEVFEADDKGNIEGTWNYHYKYDSNGNWIQQIGIIDNEEIYIVDREIEYY